MLVALRSRRHIAPFALHRPDTLAEALALRSAPGPSAFLAGGLDLIDWLKQGNAVDRLIRLDGLPDLATVSDRPDGLRIGAMVRHAGITDSALIRGAVPDLAELWNGIANPRVRFSGTIGGNVMAGRPEYDALPALMALGAEAEVALAPSGGAEVTPIHTIVAGEGGPSTHPSKSAPTQPVMAGDRAREGAEGPPSTALSEPAPQAADANASPVLTDAGRQRIPLDHLAALTQPLVTAFVIPVRAPATLRLFADRSLRPVITVWCGLTLADQLVATLRLAVGMAYPSAVCATMPLDLPLASLGANAADIAAGITRLLPEPVSDGQASAAYRRRMTGVLTRRILVRIGSSA
ncbi:FAD binding domain-containing protein [Rhodopila sp.]|uniref:FAD binding domain-containing protein n=1 Tax=Rhodopila sp. TaxID=2480087 RepID=UPI003D139665